MTWCCVAGEGEGVTATSNTHFTLVGCFNHAINENRMTNSTRRQTLIQRSDLNYSLNKEALAFCIILTSDPVSIK